MPQPLEIILSCRATFFLRFPNSVYLQPRGNKITILAAVHEMPEKALFCWMQFRSSRDGNTSVQNLFDGARGKVVFTINITVLDRGNS